MLHKSYSTNPKDDDDAKSDIGSFLADVKRCEQIRNDIYTFPPHSGHITSLVFLVLLKHTTALSFVGLNDICLASNP